MRIELFYATYRRRQSNEKYVEIMDGLLYGILTDPVSADQVLFSEERTSISYIVCCDGLLDLTGSGRIGWFLG